MKQLRLVKLLSMSGCLVASMAVGRVALHVQNVASPAVPIVIERKEPVFPGITTDLVVLVKTTIAPDGGVVAAVPTLSDPRAAEWQGFARCGRAAAEAVKAWRFRQSGATEVTTLVGISFQRPAHVSPGRIGWESVAESVPVGGKVKSPRKVIDAFPVYPAGVVPAAREPGVLAEITVDADGIPVDGVPLEPMSELTGPALDAALHWRFEPDAKVPRKRVKVTVPFVVGASFGPPAAEWPRAFFIGPSAWTRPEKNVVLPKKILDVKPRYSAEAMKKHQQGKVMIEALLGADGTLQAGRITRSLPLLDRQALECVRQWSFTPLLVDGQPTPAVITVELNFALR
jgi:TonB family protein